MIGNNKELIFVVVMVLLFCGVISGCSAFSHGVHYAEYKNRLLPLSTPSGSNRLEQEANYDPVLKHYIEDYGKPNFIYIESRYKVHAFYVAPEKYVFFVRPALSPLSKVLESQNIPSEFKKLIATHIRPVKKNQETPSPPPPKSQKKIFVSTGTGFAVSNSKIITAFHVVENADRISVKFEHGNWLPAILIKYSNSTGAAVLKLDAKTSNYIALKRNADCSLGDDVFTIGHPAIGILGSSPKYTQGTISSLKGIMDDDVFLQTTTPIQPGNSGGALVKNNGAVVGVITSTAAVKNFFSSTGSFPQNINWATKIQYIFPLLEQEDFDDGAKMLSKSKLIQLVRSSTCLIKCLQMERNPS